MCSQSDGGSHMLDAGNARQRIFDRTGDLVFNLGRGSAALGDGNGDYGKIYVGELFDRQLKIRDQPRQGQGKEQGYHWYRIADRPGGNAKAHLDRKSVVEGKRVSVRVDPGGRSIIKQKIKHNTRQTQPE